MDKATDNKPGIKRIKLDEVSNLQLVRISRLGEKLGLPREDIDWLEKLINGGLNKILETPSKSKNEEIKTIKLKIRHFVEASAPWHQIRDTAWKLFDVDPSPEVARTIAELIFLHGSIEEIKSALKILAKIDRSFYYLIQPELRNHVILRLWKEKCETTIAYYFTEKNKLLPLELFFVYWFLCHSQHRQQALRYLPKL